MTDLRLYHAASSYYSMIARFALAENAVAYTPEFVDIHARMTQQTPPYVRINPHMTVPTLVGPDFSLIESRDIAEYAFGLKDGDIDAETRGWLDLHYGFPIEELTFGIFLKRNPVARLLFPRRLAQAHAKLVRLAAENPDLRTLYEERAHVFAGRMLAFDPRLAWALAERRRGEAIGFLDRLETALSDGRSSLVASRYGVADVVWTVFLARIEFVGLIAETEKRPALARYWRAAQARPAFMAADIWTKMHFGRLIGGILGLR